MEIEDEGIGIPKNERHRIFQRFYRGGEASVQEQPGSGVGLYLTRRIVEAHGGMIRAADAVKNVRNADRSRKKQENRGGTTFIIQLPQKDI